MQKPHSARFRLGRWESAVNRRLEKWEAEKFARRLWEKDPTLWSQEPKPELSDRLGWLELPDSMRRELENLASFSAELRRAQIETIVLLGMGGSSLAPEVFQETFGNLPGFPRLLVLDSTHPHAVAAIEGAADLSRSVFLVSSKSGTTTETLSFFYYFWDRVGSLTERPGDQFVAITDPGTPLVSLARDRSFRRTFEAPPDVGGRYAALTFFGLVPAALIGIAVQDLLDQGLVQARACAAGSLAQENPGLRLGAALGELALGGKDKVTFLTSPSLKALPAWIEQLIAESTGKDDQGILPVADEMPLTPAAYGIDRCFVCLRLKGEGTEGLDSWIASVEAQGHPTVQLEIAEKPGIAQEFFRWEVAIAAAGAVLGIHPFNQPDVQFAKDLAREAMRRAQERQDEAKDPGISVEKSSELKRSFESWYGTFRPGDYVSIHAYLAPSPSMTTALQEIRHQVCNIRHCATTVGYGPRFLHSTGQLHKGGPNTGLFLQLVDEPSRDLRVPETSYSFGELIRAQALGDLEALRRRGRRVLRVRLGPDAAGGIQKLAHCLRP